MQSSADTSANDSGFGESSLELHRRTRGKIETGLKVPLESGQDLSLAYTPGVATVSQEIAKNRDLAWEYTIKRNTVAVVTDGSAVLGLGNIGPEAALPVMEGKVALLKKLGGVDGFPICVQNQDAESIISTVKNISPAFGGINLEDIAAPKCFAIEDALQDIGIPVFHDDQWGTAIVVLAAIINATKVVGRELTSTRVVICGSGAAGAAVARFLVGMDGWEKKGIKQVLDIILVDSKGTIWDGREDLGEYKQRLAKLSNSAGIKGGLTEAMDGADIFIGVSRGEIVTREMVAGMSQDAIVLAMANPTPEIWPQAAKAAGAKIVGTGRSDLVNQINNVLVFPGIFRGALDAKAPRITFEMKMAAAIALAECVVTPTANSLLPSPLDNSVHRWVADAVKSASP